MSLKTVCEFVLCRPHPIVNVIVDPADDMSASGKAQQANLLKSKNRRDQERNHVLIEMHQRFDKFAEVELDKLTATLNKLSEQNRALKEWPRRKSGFSSDPLTR